MSCRLHRGNSYRSHPLVHDFSYQWLEYMAVMDITMGHHARKHESLFVRGCMEGIGQLPGPFVFYIVPVSGSVVDSLISLYSSFWWERFLLVFFSVYIELLLEILLISTGFFANDFLLELPLVCARFYMGGIDKDMIRAE
ncbi:hypothetical protein HNO89_001616 [Sporosarcina luteola]|nr:hypothetical protein [Sporosarcina luteola]